MSAAYFGSDEVLKNSFAHWQGVPVEQLGPGALVVAGGAAGATFWTISYPIDVIKSKLQTQNVFAPDRYRGVLDCGRRLYEAEGWRALFRGFLPCILRSVPANSAAFLAFEQTRTFLTG